MHVCICLCFHSKRSGLYFCVCEVSHFWKSVSDVTINQMSLMFTVYLLCSTALVEEPPREVVLRTSGDTSLQGSFSSHSAQMSASQQEASFSSFSSSAISSMTEMKFASMSAQSMSSMQESIVEMSSSSFMGKSSMTQLESSSSRMLKAGIRGKQ